MTKDYQPNQAVLFEEESHQEPLPSLAEEDEEETRPLHICSQQYFTFVQPVVFVFHTSIAELDNGYLSRFVHLGNKVEE